MGLKSDGSIDYYPSLADGYSNGFDGLITKETLKPGTRIDRFGDLHGSFVALEGTPFQNRALPPDSKNKPYNLFEVNEPNINTQSGHIAS